MKKYLLTLCLTMLAVVTSWAQTNGWGIDISQAPVYVEFHQRQYDTNQAKPWIRNFTITTPASHGTIAVEAVVANTGYATAEVAPKAGGAENEYTVTFSPVAIGITSAYIQIKENGTVVSKTEATPIEVNVYDMDLARSITNPGAQNVQKGKTLELPINITPASATLAATSSNAKVSASYDKTTNILTIDATDASVNTGDKTTITLTPADGSKDRSGNTVNPVSFEVTVVKPEFPITYSSLSRDFHVGETWTSPLEAPVGSTYTVSYTRKQVVGYPADVIEIQNNTTDPIKASLTAKKVGRSQVYAVITPTGTSEEAYSPWIRTLDITVSYALMQPILTVTPSADKKTWTPTLTVNLDPTPNAVINPTDYTVEYSVEGALPESVEVDEDGVVTIKNSETTQAFYLVATVTPTNSANCLGGTARALIKIQGSVTGAYLEKQADGTTWIAYLASPEETLDNIVAKFEVRSKYAGDEGKTPWALLENLRQNGEVINVSGSINTFNIAQLAHAMGVDEGATTITGAMKTLDMSGCHMDGAFTMDQFPVNGVKVEYRNTEGTVVYTDDSRMGKHLSFKNVKSFTFPKPDPEYTVLPAGMNRFFGDSNDPSHNNIETLVIPEGWTEVPAEFSGHNASNNTAWQKLTTLKLANSVQKIGAYAFSGMQVEVLTMPYNIHRIDHHAFDPADKLQDVYFVGPAPEFVHTFAFAGNIQMCNNTVHDGGLQGKIDPEITRFEYYVGNPKVLACLLHFPEQYRAYYTDVTREYKRLTDEEVAKHADKYWGDAKYSKGWKMYMPEGWTTAFLTAVKNRSDKNPNAYVKDDGMNYGAKDAYYGLDMIWPSQDQMSTGYAIAQAGYQWSGQPLRTADQYNPNATYAPSATDQYGTLVDRRGLYQFIVAMSNADIDITFEKDKWYTIAVPFNMTVEDIKKVFGPDTQVCRFSKVTRITDGEDKQIKLEFRNSVMGDITGTKYNGTSYNHAKDNSDAEAIYKGDNITGILHHFPYMIRPTGTTENEYVQFYEGKYHFDALDFPRITGTLHTDVIKPTNEAGTVTADIDYTFAPILSTTKIKTNSYVLVEKDGHHKYAFYKGKLEGGKYVPGGSANQNTSYVQMTEADGKSDYELFFQSVDPNAPQIAGAKMFSFFGDDEDDAPTAIEKVVIVCGQDGIEDNIVYTINGVRVNGDYLPAGIYIKNGKKFIVK